MNFVEFIGFIVSLLAMFFLFGKKVRDERLRKQNPEKYAAEEKRKEMALKKMMHSLQLSQEEEVDEEPDEEELEEESRAPIRRPQSFQRPVAAPPAPVVARQERPRFQSALEQDRYQSSIAKRAPLTSISREDQRFEKSLSKYSFSGGMDSAPAYEVKRFSSESRGEKLIKQLPSRRDMLVYKEIFGPPMAMRNPMDNLS